MAGAWRPRLEIGARLHRVQTGRKEQAGRPVDLEAGGVVVGGRRGDPRKREFRQAAETRDQLVKAHALITKGATLDGDQHPALAIAFSGQGIAVEGSGLDNHRRPEGGAGGGALGTRDLGFISLLGALVQPNK